MTRDIFQDVLNTPLRHRPSILGADPLSFEGLIVRAERISRALSAMDNEGRVVVSCLPHSLNSIAMFLAATIAGKVLVPVNPKAPAAERDHIIRDSRATLWVAAADDPRLSEGAALDEELGLSFQRLKQGEASPVQSGDAVIIYTSGSTGPAKGAVHTVSSLSSNVTAVAEYLELTPDDRLATFTPPSFSYSISQTLTHLWAGAAILPWPHGMMEPMALLGAHQDFKLTGIQANPSILSVLASVAAEASVYLPDVRYVQSAGQPLVALVAEQLRTMCPGARIANVYGCTENGPRVSYKWLPEAGPEKNGVLSVGIAVRGTHIRIVDAAGAQVPSGETGEVAISGSSLMRTYLGRPDQMAERMDGDWFRTSDLGFVDIDGELYIQGRADNIVLVGHEKVSPEEIEDLLTSVPGILEVAVGAIPDALLYQVAAALLVVQGAPQEVIAEARRRAREVLSRAKGPRRYFIVDAIPRTGHGKIDRRAVAALLQREAGRAAAPDH